MPLTVWLPSLSQTFIWLIIFSWTDSQDSDRVLHNRTFLKGHSIPFHPIKEEDSVSDRVLDSRAIFNGQ
jgi:hypothetical protein